ncbi:hypothetical protein BT69DRAFT_1293197 [Atractiella rhizophila]|nr:hypothetical protein BT69DRAFT_1293197 [Atractiella rhizophila]
MNNDLTLQHDSNPPLFHFTLTQWKAHNSVSSPKLPVKWQCLPLHLSTPTSPTNSGSHSPQPRPTDCRVFLELLTTNKHPIPPLPYETNKQGGKNGETPDSDRDFYLSSSHQPPIHKTKKPCSRQDDPATATDTTGTPTGTATETPKPKKDHSNQRIAAAAGTVGGLVLFGLFFIILITCRRKTVARRDRKKWEASMKAGKKAAVALSPNPVSSFAPTPSQSGVSTPTTFGSVNFGNGSGSFNGGAGGKGEQKMPVAALFMGLGGVGKEKDMEEPLPMPPLPYGRKRGGYGNGNGNGNGNGGEETPRTGSRGSVNGASGDIHPIEEKDETPPEPSPPLPTLPTSSSPLGATAAPQLPSSSRAAKGGGLAFPPQAVTKRENSPEPPMPPPKE